MYALVHRALVLAVVLVAATGTVLPQGVGLVSGRVTDEQGVLMSGVIVTLTSPGFPGATRTITDEQGRYWFRAVPGSHPLTLRAEAPGKIPVEYEGHMARRNGAVSIDFKLRSPGNHDILVLIEDGVPYHNVALQGALSTMPGEFTTLVVSNRGPATVRELQERLEERPSAVLAIGETAARLARRHVRDVPVVFSMVPAPLDSDLTTRNMCGVPLNGGFEAQMGHLTNVTRQVRRVGTVFDPHRMGRCLKDLKTEAREAGLELVAAQVHGGGEEAFSQALEELQGKDLDAFLVLLDPRTTDARNFYAITRFAEAEDIVLAVPDRSLVIPGKSFSFVPGFWDLGAYAGRLVRQIVEGDRQPPEIGITYPDIADLESGPTLLEWTSPSQVLPGSPSASLGSSDRDSKH